MKYRKIAVVVGIVILLLCIGLYIFIYTIPELTGSLKTTAIVNYGEMRISEKHPAVIVRKEVIHDASFSGNVTYYVNNNTKTRKNILVLDIYGEDKESVYCPATGVISYYYDGYEDALNFDTLDQVGDIIPAEGTIKVSNLQKERVEKNDHLYKLISSDTWYTVLFVPTENLPRYSEGSKVSLEFETGSVTAEIDRIIEKEDTSLVIVSTSKYFADYDKIRQCDVEIVLQDDKGLIIPNSAIAIEDRLQGVYVKKIDGSFVFTQIKVINTDGSNSVVYADTFDNVSTISIYDEILKNASDENKAN